MYLSNAKPPLNLPLAYSTSPFHIFHPYNRPTFPIKPSAPTMHYISSLMARSSLRRFGLYTLAVSLMINIIATAALWNDERISHIPWIVFFYVRSFSIHPYELCEQTNMHCDPPVVVHDIRPGLRSLPVSPHASPAVEILES